MTIATVSPATGETLATFEALRDDEIEARLQRAVEGFRVNRARRLDERSRLMRSAADCLEQRKNEYGRLITTEMGKPVKAAIAEVQKCALVCHYYAEHAPAFLADESVKTDAEEGVVRRFNRLLVRPDVASAAVMTPRAVSSARQVRAS